jgi:hypothetical protein
VDDEARARLRADEKLLKRAEQALAEIKVAHGLDDRHASVLAALRIRLKGDPGKNLEDLLTAAGDLGSGPSLEGLMDEPPPTKRSLDDVLAEQRESKPEWPEP